MDDADLWLALRGTPGLTRRDAQRLVGHFGSPRAIYAASEPMLRGFAGPALGPVLATGPDVARIEQERARARALGLQLIGRGDPAFPERLRVIPDAPLGVWIRGRLPQEGRTIAIVGARRASRRARETALRFASAAARAGVAVISGLAYGVDAAAHTGALEGAGPTVAVLASGLERATPRGNARLAARLIDAGGAWLSEYPPGTIPYAGQFPERNRLISGLADAVLVVEAGERSGSLWTVRHALDQGRDVWTVPGPIDTASCRGSNRLLRDGATPILEEADLLEALGLDRGPRAALPALSPDAARVHSHLDRGPLDVDSLARELALDPANLAAALLELELAELIHREGPLVLPARA